MTIQRSSDQLFLKIHASKSIEKVIFILGYCLWVYKSVIFPKV